MNIKSTDFIPQKLTKKTNSDKVLKIKYPQEDKMKTSISEENICKFVGIISLLFILLICFITINANPDDFNNFKKNEIKKFENAPPFFIN